MEHFHSYLEKHWIIVWIGFERLLLHTLPQNNSYILTCGCECMCPLIETSLCAQALWVGVSRGLGRNPPSSYPSREQFAAKPNLGFPALNKPSHGTGQRAGKDKERETKGKGEAVKIKISCWCGTNKVVCMCFVSISLPQDLKMGFGPFRGPPPPPSLPAIVFAMKKKSLFLFLSIFPPYVIYQAFFTLVESFVFVPHHQST